MRKYLLGFIIIGMIGAVSAFPTSIQPVDRTATVDDPAEFNIQVENDFVNNRSFRISSISSPPPTGSWFSYDDSMEIAPGETKNITVKVTPPKTAIQQNYRFDINVRTISGDNKETVSDYFNVNSGSDLKITSTGLSGNSFLPGEKLDTNITVFNTAPRPLNYEVKASLLNDTSTQAGAIVSGTDRTHSLRFQVPEDASPGEYTLETVILREGSQEQSITQTVTVKPVQRIDRDSEKEDRVLEYTRTLHATNKGNSEAAVELNQTLPGYLEPLTSFGTPVDRTSESEDGKTYYWSFNLQPGETASVSYKVRYWPPLLVAGLLFAGIVLLKRLYTGVSFTKKVEKREDGVKVHLEIRNGSGHRIDDVTVTDFVPDIASVKEDFPMAKPVVRKTNNGTRLSWEIDKMMPGEQRVFEYNITPLVEVEGGVTLPEAELEIDEQKVAETNEQTVDFKPE